VTFGRDARRARGAAALRRALRVLALALGLASAAWTHRAQADAALHEGVAYAGSGGDGRTLDLYLPAAGAARPPLLVFVESHFWHDDDRAAEIAKGLARPLQRAGAAVALVRHRPAPEYRHPAAAEDVAAALAFLVAHAGEYGYDPARIALAGRSSGAQLAALVALDPRYLAAQKLSPDSLLGVAALSGMYDLAPPRGFASPDEEALVAKAFPDTAARRDASPMRHLRKDAPLFLITFAESDLPGAQEAGFAFAKALRDAGHPAAEAFGIPGRDYRTQLDLADESNPLRKDLIGLLDLTAQRGWLRDTFATRSYWRAPKQSSAGFWEDAKSVEQRDATPEFLRDLNLLFSGSPAGPRLRPKRFQALDLFAWLERHADRVGRGRYLVLTNARGEKVSWELEALRPYQPLIVIGADDERELFRLVDFYHTDRRTTWQQPEAEEWILARPVGAFLHFAKPAPDSIDPRAIGRFALTPESFSRVDEDPLAPLRSLTPAEQRVLTEDFRCVSCHTFRGAGARASHIRAKDGELVGGYGLPLEEYPREVWRRYCFEQEKVAAEIGATPVQLGDRAQMLFEMVERERAKAGR